MKKLIAILALVAVAVGGRAALPQPDLIAQIHFAGAQKISADNFFSAFTNEFSSAEAHALASQTLDKLSHVPGAWFKTKIPADAGDGAVQLRPLFDDLLASEWFFEARDTVNGSPEFALAIRLSDARAQLWENNLQQLLEAWTKIPAKKISGGWELKKHEPPNLIRVTDHGGWLVAGCGQNELPLSKNIPGEIFSKQSKYVWSWLSLDVNWPRLAQWFPGLKEFGLPETQFTVTAPDTDLRINGKFFFSENLSPALEAWRVPTNTLHQPFISFTAVRGFASWLKQRPWAQPYQISPAPNQLFVWALPQIPFQTFAAMPVPNAAEALNQAYARLLPVFNSSNAEFLTPFTLELTNNEIGFRGVPFISPYLQAKQEPAGQFLLAGAFPNSPRSKPLPTDLFMRLAEKNLVFYHWEITAERLPQVLNLSQLGLMLTSHKQLEGNSAALKWVQKIGPTLGNTITEITQSGPAEMTFTRKAPGGFTAVELFALANWLEAANFPGCNLKLPPRPVKLKRPHPQPPDVMTAPAPAH